MNSNIAVGKPVNVGPPSPEQLALIEDLVETEPKIIESGFATLIGRYANQREGDVILTPDTVIELGEGDDTQSLTVFSGYSTSDSCRKVVFQRDPETNQAAEWIVVAREGRGTTMADGSGRPLVSETDRRFVRSVLDAMKTSYDRDVTAVADSFDTKKHLVEAIDGSIAQKEAELANLRRQRQQAEQDSAACDRFRVTIESGWANDGELSLDEVISAPSLSEALRQATGLFMLLNSRTDVQASAFSVGVSAGEDQFWEVPRRVVLPLFQALSRFDSEGRDIAHAKDELTQ